MWVSFNKTFTILNILIIVYSLIYKLHKKTHKSNLHMFSTPAILNPTLILISPIRRPIQNSKHTRPSFMREFCSIYFSGPSIFLHLVMSCFYYNNCVWATFCYLVYRNADYCKKRPLAGIVAPLPHLFPSIHRTCTISPEC